MASSRGTEHNQTPNVMETMSGSQTMGDKVHGQEGNSPDPQLRSPIYAKWKTMWNCENNQDVGLEAAILQRVRNSSLVE